MRVRDRKRPRDSERERETELSKTIRLSSDTRQPQRISYFLVLLKYLREYS